MLKNCVKILDIYVWILEIAMFRIEGTLDGKTAFFLPKMVILNENGQNFLYVGQKFL